MYSGFAVEIGGSRPGGSIVSMAAVKSLREETSRSMPSGRTAGPSTVGLPGCAGSIVDCEGGSYGDQVFKIAVEVEMQKSIDLWLLTSRVWRRDQSASRSGNLRLRR